MFMRKCFTILMVISYLVLSCKEDNVSPEQNISCDELTAALIDNEGDNIKEIINQVLHSYEPHDSNKPDDKERLEALIKQLESCPDIKVTDSCYACMQSLPPQSGISLEIHRDGQIINKFMQLKHDNQNNLSFSIIY